jgi:hypothetical protein
LDHPVIRALALRLSEQPISVVAPASASMGPVASACSLGPAPDSNSWPINFAIWAIAVRGIVLGSSHPSSARDYD